MELSVFLFLIMSVERVYISKKENGKKNTHLVEFAILARDEEDRVASSNGNHALIVVKVNTSTFGGGGR